jgi:hypothetical protein
MEVVMGADLGFAIIATQSESSIGANLYLWWELGAGLAILPLRA